MIKTTSSKLIILFSIFLVLSGNLAFFRNVADVYSVSQPNNLIYIGSLSVLLTGLIILLFTLSTPIYTTKPVLTLILLVSSVAGYFMNEYNVVIDQDMIRNISQTNVSETMDLLSLKLMFYFLFLGVLPSVFVYKANIEYGSLKKELVSKLKVIIISILIIASQVFMFSKFYTSFVREHKPLRYYTNPTYYLYSLGKYITSAFHNGETVITPIGTDAKIPVTDEDRELIVLVIGEAVRADRFSLNGYPRETNPLLMKEDVISFSNMHSCGTSTAVSVPCMFSIFNRTDYKDGKAKSTENMLDVLRHAGIHILWRDNNSSSKGVAVNVTYEDYRSPYRNTVCDTECRDEGMLEGLQEYIDSQEDGDILIVLHQMGNHGPAYYRRYPKAFEKFTPVCMTNELEKCSREEINNAYDNAVLYTDYFLSKVISLLKQNSAGFESSLVYISDHGESLGENHLYLHGLPYWLAPENQKHVAALMWFGKSFNIDRDSLRDKTAEEFSHDNLFHTILGLMELGTSVYDKKMDIINFDE